MHIRAIIAIARKDAIDLILNKSTLFTLLSPFFVAVLYLIINIIIPSGPSRLLIYNPGNSPLQQIASSSFQNPEVVYASSASEVADAFGPNGTHKSSPYTMGLVIPPNFEAQIRQGKHPQLQFYANGSQLGANYIHAMSTLLAEYASSVAAPHPLQISQVTINPPSSAPSFNLSATFTTMALLISLMTGIYFIPHLLIEEKEKKTLRMLMVSPASFTDVILGKMLVVLVYQLLISCIAIALLQGFFGNVPILILFALLGVSFALSLGLFAGGLFQSNGALGGFINIVSILLVLPVIIVELAPSLTGNSNLILQIIKILPGYYIAQGAYDALTNQSSLHSILLNGGIILGWVVVLCIGAVYSLQRQAQVVGTI